MPLRFKVYAFILYVLAFISGGSAIYYTIKKANGVTLTLLWILTVSLILVASFLSFTAGDQDIA